MFKLSNDELDAAFSAINHHGYSAMLPEPLEWKSIQSNWEAVRDYLSSRDLDQYEPYDPLKVFAPKSASSIRVTHLLHPEDIIIYTALVLIVKDDIESARVSRNAKRVFSYRVDQSNRHILYNTRGDFEAYQKQLNKKASKNSVRYVAVADIADFFPRIYQHRLENIVETCASDQRGIDVARVLVKKMISRLMKRNSYGIPVGPYASRILAEAVLVDVDSHLQSQGVDFVRWADDYNIFSRSFHSAQTSLYSLGEFLYINHGLTLQSAKTDIYSDQIYEEQFLDAPEDRLADRDKVISMLLEDTGGSGYDDELCDPDDLDEDEINDTLLRLQKYDLESMLNEAIEDEESVDFDVFRYVLSRLPRIAGSDDELKKKILDIVLDNIEILHPEAEHIAKYIVSFNHLDSREKKKIASKLLRPIGSKINPPPDYYVMWILYVFSTSVGWNHSKKIAKLYQDTRSMVVKRYAALALSVCGGRSDVVAVKEDLASANDLLRLAILKASNLLGADERKHWILSNQTRGIVEKKV